MMFSLKKKLKSSSFCPMFLVKFLHITSAVKELLLKCTLLNPRCSHGALPALGSGTCKPLFELIKIIVFLKTAWPRKREVTRVGSFFGFICRVLVEIIYSSNNLKFMTL